MTFAHQEEKFSESSFPEGGKNYPSNSKSAKQHLGVKRNGEKGKDPGNFMEDRRQRRKDVGANVSKKEGKVEYYLLPPLTKSSRGPRKLPTGPG